MHQNGNNASRGFWLGNAVLAIALVVLITLGKLWELIGVWAIVIWLVLVALGVFLLLKNREDPTIPS